MKRKNQTYGSPANAPLTFQALQAHDFPLKNRNNKLSRSQSNTQDQHGTRLSGGGSPVPLDSDSGGGAGANNVANTRIFINSSVPASLFTATATSTQLPEPDAPHVAGVHLNTSLLPADMGMLRPTAAQRMPQNGLPSGTHIRRRPRSVARLGGGHASRQQAAAVAAANAANGSDASPNPAVTFGSPQQVFIGPSRSGPAFEGAAPYDALAQSQFMSPELLSLSPAPMSEEMGVSSSAATTTATLPGATAPTLSPPGKTAASRAGRDAKPLKYVRRAAPSPAPSRPVRANRRRQLPTTAALPTKTGTPTDQSLATDNWPIRVSGSQQAAPLTRFTAATATLQMENDQVVLGQSDDDSDSGEHSLSAMEQAAAAAAAAARAKEGADARPKSGRRLAALGETPVSASLASSLRVSETLDFYLKLCAEVGEEPFGEWVRALEQSGREGTSGAPAAAAAAAGGPRKTRKESGSTAATQADSKATPGLTRRAKSPGLGTKTTLKRSSSTGGAARGRVTATPPAGATQSTTTLAPGGGQRPPLTRQTKTSTSPAPRIEEEVRLYCKTHLYPCLQKIGKIEKYRQTLKEVLDDFKAACDELPHSESAAKALLAAEVATASATRHGAVVRSGHHTTTASATGPVAPHRRGTQSAVNSPPTESLAATGTSDDGASTLSRLAARLTLDLAKLQDGATGLLLTLAKYSKEARRPIGTVGNEDGSGSVNVSRELTKEVLMAPQSFNNRLAKEEIKTARLLESIRVEVETCLAGKPCVRVDDAGLFQTPLLFSTASASSASPPGQGQGPRVRGESGRALTLSHRSGTNATNTNTQQVTPRGTGRVSGTSPEPAQSSPSPIATRRHSGAAQLTDATTSGRQRLMRGAGASGGVVSAGRPTLAPVVMLVLPSSRAGGRATTPTSHRSSVHSESGKPASLNSTGTATSGKNSKAPGNNINNNTVLFVITSSAAAAAGGGDVSATFSRRGSFDSLSSASQSGTPAHPAGEARRVERGSAAAAAAGTKAVGAGRSRSASAGVSKQRGSATGSAAVKRSGSVKAGRAAASAGGAQRAGGTGASAAGALPLRTSLRTSSEWPDGDVGKSRDGLSSSTPGVEATSSLALTASSMNASMTILSSRGNGGPSREELEEAKSVWDAVSTLARQSARLSSGSSPRMESTDRKHSNTSISTTSKSSDKTPMNADTTAPTAEPSPAKSPKGRPSTADTFVSTLATFDNNAKAARASSETGPERGDVHNVLKPIEPEPSSSSPPPQASLGSTTMVYEGGFKPSHLLDSENGPMGSRDGLPQRPLHGIDSRGSNSLVCSPDGLGPLPMSANESESSPVVHSVSDADGTVESLLSHTLPVVASVTAGTSEPPSAERLQQVRHAVQSRRGRSQSILQVAPANEKEVVAVKLIRAYYRRFRARKQLAAKLEQRRKDDAEERRAQEKRVSEQRVKQFLWSIVQRRRTQRAVAAQKREKQLQAVNAAAAEAQQNAAAKSAAVKASSGKALTSRERLQLAKEQRESMRRDDEAVTARPSAISTSLETSPAKSGAHAASAAATVPVPNLPLTENGITTNAIANYNREGDSFEVAVLHRLLLAPKALLFAVRSAIDAYPIRPPMAYAKPTEDVRRGETSVSPDRASQTPERDDPDGAWDPKKGNNSFVVGPSDASREAKDRRDGVMRMPFALLRPYLLYYAELSAQSQAAAASTTTTTASSNNNNNNSNINAASRNKPVSANLGPTAILLIPRSVRYESYVDVDELRHDKPVVKPFPRPFEAWGSSFNLVRRIFSAAAMYAWKLIFSHTPHDDYKQRQLRSRDEQASRLDRVDQRNRMILACYAVHSEREWLREASKDLSFVGQIFNPKRSMDPNDPDLDRHCRETYEFVEDFLYQCFPTVSSLDEVPSFLVGAGMFFVLKEVFQWRADAPDSAVVLKQLPGWVLTHDQLIAPRSVVQSQRDSFLDSHPNVAMFHEGCGGSAARKAGCQDNWLTATGGARQGAASSLASQPVDVFLTGFQHFEMLRYEQLCLLQRLARWIYEQRPITDPKVSNVFSPLSPQQSMEVTTGLTQSSAAEAAAQFLSRRTDDGGDKDASPAAGLTISPTAAYSLTSPHQTSIKVPDDDANAGGKRRLSDNSGGDELLTLHTTVSSTSIMHDRLADSTRVGSAFASSVLGGGTTRHQKQLTPAERRQDAEEAKKEQQILPVKLVVMPATAVQAVKQQQQTRGAATSSVSASGTPSRNAAASAAGDRKSTCDFEHEQFIKQRQHKVSIVLSRYLEGAAGSSTSTSTSTSKPTRVDRAGSKKAAASTPETEKSSIPGSEFMMVYPKNFLVDLSEKLTYELLGLRLHLGVCEELDAV